MAKQGATAVLGLAYWAVATHLFSARDVGLAAAASSTAFFLAAIGALGIPLLLLAELDSLPAAVRRVTFSTGMSIACLAVLILSLATLALSPFLGDSLRIIGADSDNRRSLRDRISGDNGRAHSSTTRQSDCTGARPS